MPPTHRSMLRLHTGESSNPAHACTELPWKPPVGRVQCRQRCRSPVETGSRAAREAPCSACDYGPRDAGRLWQDCGQAPARPGGTRCLVLHFPRSVHSASLIPCLHIVMCSAPPTRCPTRCSTSPSVGPHPQYQGRGVPARAATDCSRRVARPAICSLLPTVATTHHQAKQYSGRLLGIPDAAELPPCTVARSLGSQSNAGTVR